MTTTNFKQQGDAGEVPRDVWCNRGTRAFVACAFTSKMSTQIDLWGFVLGNETSVCFDSTTDVLMGRHHPLHSPTTELGRNKSERPYQNSASAQIEWHNGCNDMSVWHQSDWQLLVPCSGSAAFNVILTWHQAQKTAKIAALH